MALPDVANAVGEERAALATTLETVGPDAPTLAGTWTALDVAAHVLSLDRFLGVPTFIGRSIVARGVRLNDLAGRFADRGLRPVRRGGLPRLVDALGRPPPRLLLRRSVAPIGLVEVFVHHQDVRRANALGRRPGAARSELGLRWLLRYQRSRLRDMTLVVDVDVADHRGGDGGPEVRLTGELGEVVLWLAGRREVAEVELAGDADAIAALEAAAIRI